jgi:NtrC-family two-component system response regulator AlgB
MAARKQVEVRRLEQRIEELERAVDPESALLDSAAPAMAQTLAMARQVSGSDANVLLLGESVTIHLIAASVLILGGVFGTISARNRDI